MERLEAAEKYFLNKEFIYGDIVIIPRIIHNIQDNFFSMGCDCNSDSGTHLLGAFSDIIKKIKYFDLEMYPYIIDH